MTTREWRNLVDNGLVREIDHRYGTLKADGYKVMQVAAILKAQLQK